MEPENEVINTVDSHKSIKFGKILAHPAIGEEVVISGLSGRYPESRNVHEFRDNLFNKVDMVSGDDRRWKPGSPEIPHRTGKVPDIDQFDAGFFGIHHRQATQMDPMCRLLLEVAIEATCDAGIHPSELEGSNTGVFVGACFNESEKTWFTDKIIPQGFAVLGNERSMLAHRISNVLKLKGPSFICDTACSSSLYALENAYKAIRMGECDKAIVGGTNLCLQPFLSLQLARLGVLSLDGECRPFDAAGNGYVRAEAISAIVLQKSKDAKRIYSTIVHAKTNCDGYKNSGITSPSGEMQIRLLKEFYEECFSVKPSDLSFLETHGTGTKIGDPEELQAIDEIFTKGRSTPLLIGSIKSNIGHTEPSSGLCSITKVIIATETGYIPPNLHYTTCRPGIKALEEGRLKVVVDKVPFNDNKGLIGVNGFGFGGGNCHVLLRQNSKIKVNNGKAKDNIPRLVCVSGRTKEAADVLLDDVIANNVDVEHVRLLHELFRKNINGHLFRGYSLLSKSGDEISRSVTSCRNPRASNLVLGFGNIDRELIKKAPEFLELPIAATTLQRIHQVLGPRNINILSLLSTSNISSILDLVLVSFTIQVLFADIIKACEIVPNKIFGLTKDLSLGTLVCIYFDGALTLEESTACAYYVALAADSINCCDCIGTSVWAMIEQRGSIATTLQQSLASILKQPRRLSKKVIFHKNTSEISSVHLTKCFDLDSVLEDAKSVLTKDSVFFEVGNGEISQLLRKRLGAKSRNVYINTNAGINTMLSSLGRLYEAKFNPQIQNLYPKIEFPVSRGTPMISSKIKWMHNRNWFVTSYEPEMAEVDEKTTSLLINDPIFAFLSGHVIDGRNVMPPTGYLQLAWETLAYIHGLAISDMKVVFENCKFNNLTPIPKEGTRLELIVMIQRGTGNFEILKDGVPVVSGRIYNISRNNVILDDLPLLHDVHKDRAPCMNKKDIYKELRLRGYNYSGQFKGIQYCDSSAEVAGIIWNGNWVTFMDNMLQLKILQEDTRMLYVPTSIQRCVIDAKRHIECTKNMVGEKENVVLPVYASKETGTIRSGGIEIRGLNASSTPRRKYLGIPVIEKYVFVPNKTSLKTEQALRTNLQILMENTHSNQIKIVELIDEATSKEVQPLAQIISGVIEEQPLIQSDITILSKTELKIKNVRVEDRKLLTEVECSLVMGSKILQRSNILQLAFGAIKENGFVLSRERFDFEYDSSCNKDVCIATIFTTGEEKLVLFRKNANLPISSVIKISSEDKEFSWIPKLQAALIKSTNVVIYTQGEPLNGSLGLVLCIRREPGCQNVRLIFALDSAPEFDLQLPFYVDQLNKNLAINIYKNNQWGTYRHLLLEQVNEVESEHCYLNTVHRGDLSSLTWLEAPSKVEKLFQPECSLIYVHYTSINFRDVMWATARTNVDGAIRDRREQERIQGFEFSGITDRGERVMGMVPNGACASTIVAEDLLLWKVPDDWSLQEAATVPVAYSVSALGLIHKGKIKCGDSVLIHSGAGGVGLAAIQLALHFGCTVYTTVGTPEKKTFLKDKFPQLKDRHISNSRNTEFEKRIIKQTNGRGVDVVLNSLAEETLLASVRCLASGGRFIEIGRFDLANNNSLNLLLLEKGASFHGLMIDSLFSNAKMRLQVQTVLKDVLDSHIARPLSLTVFNMTETEAAFRHMTTGKHMGKVVIELRKEQNSLSPMKFSCKPRYYCDFEKTYVICGGLGGLGMELADWLILRGCRKLVLSSRTGIKTGYQAYRIAIWRSYGCTIHISTDDINTYEGCLSLIKTTNELGSVHSIFNLAMILRDAIFENQLEESFKSSFGPKALATQHLDDVTRKLCPELRDFVVFSSVSCSRGNAGQSNYGMSNSVMERICEKRRMEGLPALAIEWGTVGDVGSVVDTQDEAVKVEVGGTGQQSIASCLEVMDILLRHNEAAIVSSIVVAEKKSRLGGAESITDAVGLILGIKNLEAISFQATLTEIGMDSMSAVKIKQTLEREYKVLLTSQEIKTLTFAKLVKIQEQRDAEKDFDVKKKRVLAGMDMIIRMIPDEMIANKLVVPIEGKPTAIGYKSTVVIFPGLEGLITIMEPMYKNLQAKLLGLQFPNNHQKDTIEEMAQIFVPIIEKNISRDEPFKIICYSFGVSIALETAKLLEQKGYFGIIICVDGAPNYLKALIRLLDVESDDQLQVSLLVRLVTLQFPYDIIGKHMETLMQCNTFDERINFTQSVVPLNSIHSPEHQRKFITNLYKRVKAFLKWTPEFKLKSKVLLFKPIMVSIEAPEEISSLSALCEGIVEVNIFDGNHLSLLENTEFVQTVNKTFGLVGNEC